MRPILRALGVAVVAFVCTLVAVVEALDIAFSALVALPVALLAAVATGTLVATRGPDIDRRVAAALDGVAGAGWTVAAGLAGRYVGALGLRSTLTFGRLLVAAVAVGLAVALASWLRGKSSLDGAEQVQ